MSFDFESGPATRSRVQDLRRSGLLYQTPVAAIVLEWVLRWVSWRNRLLAIHFEIAENGDAYIAAMPAGASFEIWLLAILRGRYRLLMMGGLGEVRLTTNDDPASGSKKVIGLLYEA